MFCISTASRSSALVGCRHGLKASSITSTVTGNGRQMSIISSQSITSAARASTSKKMVESRKNTYDYHQKMQKNSISSSSSSSSPPEPAINQSPNTPPNPISPPGQLKDSSKNASFDPFKRNTEEACQTLSPSSPAAPRTQRKPEEADSLSKIESSKAIPPEIVNRPSIGRKGSGKFRAQKAALTLTPTALERVRSLLDSNGGPKLLRIGVRNKGCAGMSYHLEYVTPDQAGKFDERVKQDGVEVLIDSKALFSIIGSEMDWQEDRLSAKFVFNNPNVIEACGCGESVRFA